MLIDWLACLFGLHVANQNSKCYFCGDPVHNKTALNCKYWTGDRAGYDLEAVCHVCERTE